MRREFNELKVMTFDAKKNALVIPAQDMVRAQYLLLHAMKKVRVIAKRPLEPHERPGVMDDFDFAQMNILDAGKAMGLEMGGDFPEQIDLRKF